LKEAQQVVRLVHPVPIAPSSSQIAELVDEPTQLRRITDETEARFHRAHEEKEKATEALKREKYEVLAQLREM
jgi:hypothetical protein